ncbi:MAG: hypothetical protein AAF394_08090 [Planctomycetota bacterium]
MAEVCEGTVRFSGEELDLAQLFKAYGLEWTPEVGHYVLDQSELIDCDSPFQDRVFFILDLKHFLRRSGTIENLKERVCWIPTWEQMRDLLREHGVSDAVMAEHLEETRAIHNGTERLELYRLFEERLTGGLM